MDTTCSTFVDWSPCTIVDDDLHEEAILLGFGERVGTFLLERVLSGQYQEWLFQFVAGVAQGHLPFLHGFQQGALDLGRGTVYFISQYEVGENGAFSDNKLVFLLVVDHCTDNVGGEQVGCELDAAELGVDSLGQGFNSQCLSEAGHAFQQDVAVGEQTDEQAVEHLMLTDDHSSNFIPQPVDKCGLVLDLVI